MSLHGYHARGSCVNPQIAAPEPAAPPDAKESSSDTTAKRRGGGKHGEKRESAERLARGMRKRRKCFSKMDSGLPALFRSYYT